MSDGGDWHELVRAFLQRGLDEADVHDRFLDRWRVLRDRSEPLHSAISDLFHVPEVYCPDPVLRTPGSPFGADDAELRASAELALARLDDDRPSGKLI